MFGPSQQCFNAINFVIVAAREYQDVFSDLTTLMERISAFFGRLFLFMNDPDTDLKLDRRLRPTVYKVLEHFVQIMGIAYKIARDSKTRLKLAAKISAFGDDGGVKASLIALETLISDVTRIEVAVIVKDLSEAARNIRNVER